MINAPITNSSPPGIRSMIEKVMPSVWGLIWRGYEKLGFLQYSFIETVEAMKPYYMIRAVVDDVVFRVGQADGDGRVIASSVRRW